MAHTPPDRHSCAGRVRHSCEGRNLIPPSFGKRSNHAGYHRKKTIFTEENTNVLDIECNIFILQKYSLAMQCGGAVYIICNHSHSVLYIGVTSNLLARIGEHKEKKYPDSFTARYHCNRLVYYESFIRIEEAIAREKQLKKWKREWKEKLITTMNPQWTDLFESL